MLSAWSGFYVLLGSSAGALTGLVFIVITLVNDRGRVRSESGVSTFTTPTVVHFCCVLFTSAVMSAPFGSLVPLAVLIGLAGLAGVVYVVRIARRAARLETYRADAEDWAWNALLPFIAYAALAGGGVALPFGAPGALFVPAAAALLLIFVGIHNAWDVVTFLALGKADDLPDAPRDAEPAKADESP